MKLHFLSILFLFLTTAGYCQENPLATNGIADSVMLGPVTILSTWASAKTPLTYTNLKKETIEKNNLGQDVPFLLRNTPSLVETSDAGAGIGYTGVRIRGSDPTRINVTLNGIPLNDAESQAVYWVDLPDFASSTEAIQIQRGVGTSTNGAGAFGASINLNTAKLHAEPYGALSNTYGSFNTWKNTISAGTGLLSNHYSVDARLSRITSDGYIDRARARLHSFFVSGLYTGANSSLRFNLFSGHELTYQAWNGVPAQYIHDPVKRHYNTAGTEKSGDPYDNEVDDYTQTHYQVIFNQRLGTDWDANISLHYTRGLGYYEQYKSGEQLSDYQLPPFIAGTDTISQSDLIRQLWLDNDFYGAIYALQYHKGPWETILGGAYNEYAGGHYGKVIWARMMNNGEKGHQYYDNDAHKKDFTAYLKTQYHFNHWLNGYLDLQFRRVAYRLNGIESDQARVDRTATLHFFNPKAGLFADLDKQQQLYISIATGNREPNRDDYVQAKSGSVPKPERLYDLELGYRRQWERASMAANFFYMYYVNQLALTGQINEVGAPIRINIPRSYRAGIELEGVYQPFSRLEMAGNIAVSRNKSISFTEYIDNWDTGLQEAVLHRNADLAFSPAIVGSAGLTYAFFKTEKQLLEANLTGKYTGKQFIDNTSNAHTALDPYFYTDVRLTYTLRNSFCRELALTLSINNLFDARYASNAWTYRYVSAGYDARPDDPYARLEGNNVYNLTGYFPQAGRNFLLGVRIGF